MKRFITIFPQCENIHLIKDVGMIPFVLHKEFQYDSSIACYNNGDYPYLESDLQGLKMVFIKKVFNNEMLDSITFILLNFRKYDILQCYHFVFQSLFLLTFFIWIKKCSFSYSFTFLKLDASDDCVAFKVKWKHLLFIKSINLISAETKRIHNILNKQQIYKKEVAYLPNGFYSNGIKEKIDFSSKENLIITVGRIGTFQKNNQILLEAFREFAVLNKDWKLELIGPIEEDFKLYIIQYFQKNPSLKERVSFTGAIYERMELEEKYKKAKIFVLTSRFEGFPLVFLESIKNGCTVLSTAITPAYDITCNERFGGLFPVGDSKSLSLLMLKTVNNSEKLKSDCELIHDYAYENFSWSKICKDLDLLINKKNGSFNNHS